MGCICSKGRFSAEDVAANHVKDKELKENTSLRQFSNSVRREKVATEVNDNVNETSSQLISSSSQNGTWGSTPISSDDGEKNGDVIAKLQAQMSSKGNGGVGQEQPNMLRIFSISRGERGAQVLAGWPSWLTSVAGEAISGWIPRRADSFKKLGKIGQGTYGSVYKACDLETNKIVALKKVRFTNIDPDSVRFMAREILVLRRLDHSNVIKLEGIITSKVSGNLYLIFEYMDHDLAKLVAMPGVKLNESQIKNYMQQLLCGLDHCHKRGVLHRDIKGSNLLVDKNGNLKIGDFGLANILQPSEKQHLTSRVVTLWYRPPELLLGATDYGVAVDLWSSGCILAELFTGKPVMPGRTEVEQLHKIFKLCGSPSEEYWKNSKLPQGTCFKPARPYKRVLAETFKDLPSSALSLLEVLLSVEPENRGTASSALESKFFTELLPCDPLTSPKYSTSKQFDAKLREEEAGRAAGNKGHEHELVKRDSREYKAVPAPNFDAELQASIQKSKENANHKCISEKYNPEEDSSLGFPIEPVQSRAVNVHSHSGQSMHPTACGSSCNMNQEEAPNPAKLIRQISCMHASVAQLSRFPKSVAVRGCSQYDTACDVNSQWPEDCFSNNRYSHLASHKKASPPLRKRHMGYALKNNCGHYSGPLLPPGGDIVEMLREHERQIQQAVRKALVDKIKNQNTGL